MKVLWVSYYNNFPFQEGVGVCSDVKRNHMDFYKNLKLNGISLAPLSALDWKNFASFNGSIISDVPIFLSLSTISLRKLKAFFSIYRARDFVSIVLYLFLFYFRKRFIKILIIQEPKNILKDNYTQRRHKVYDYIFTYYKPYLKGSSPERYKPYTVPFYIPSKTSLAGRTFFIGGVLSNIEQYGFFYDLRRRAIEEFCRCFSVEEFILWGRGWDYLPNSRGLLDSKHDFISNCTFVLAFENNADQEGYVSEKIFEALAHGAIPIYLGGDSVYDFIPKEIFIRLDHKSPSIEESICHLRSLSPAMILQMQGNIQEFIATQQFRESSYLRLASDISNCLGRT